VEFAGVKAKLMTWELYDPSWLVELARVQLPDETWLPEALSRCTTCPIEGPAYIRFVDSRQWEFETCLELQSPVEGWLVLDVLHGHRIGGVEFVDKIEV
jgi:hypothetical protein